jgi:hypothetical protein
MAPTGPPEVDDAPGLAQVLDDELRRLPDRYRAPLVLCALEGRPRADAARALGIREGTLSSRLARGRALLRERLGRRGVLLPSAAVTAALAPGAAAAALPEGLAEATVDAAVRFAAGTLSAGAAAAPAAHLAEGVLKMMLLTKVKPVAAAFACSLVLTAGVVAQSPTPVPQPPAPDAARLTEVERKLDRVLEVLGARKPPSTVTAVAPVAPAPGQVLHHPPGLPATPTTSSEPVRFVVTARSEADRINAVEERVTRVEKQIAELAGRLDRLEKGALDSANPNASPAR